MESTTPAESHMELDPIGTARAYGVLLGRYPTYSSYFLEGFGGSLLTEAQACQRIDFLYESNLDPGPESNVFRECVRVGHKKNIPWITDVTGDHRFVSIMLLRGLETDHQVYAIRLFSENDVPPVMLPLFSDCSFEAVAGQSMPVLEPRPFSGTAEQITYEHVSDWDHMFWNFIKQGRAIQPFRPSDGFSDLPMTKIVVNLLVWTTNLLGFSEEL